MKASQIQKALDEAGLSHGDIGRRFRPPKTRQQVQQVVKGERKTLAIRKSIAKAIGKDYREVWPG